MILDISLAVTIILQRSTNVYYKRYSPGNSFNKKHSHYYIGLSTPNGSANKQHIVNLDTIFYQGHVLNFSNECKFPFSYEFVLYLILCPWETYDSTSSFLVLDIFSKNFPLFGIYRYPSDSQTFTDNLNSPIDSQRVDNGCISGLWKKLFSSNYCPDNNGYKMLLHLLSIVDSSLYMAPQLNEKWPAIGRKAD